MIYWGNLAGIWLLLPVLMCYILTVFECKLKFNLLNLLHKQGLSGFGKYALRLRIKLILWFAILSMLLIAFLSPQWGENLQMVPQAGRNVVIALDVSKSMLVEDFKPNRLDFAKHKIKKLVQSLAGDRVGLILFAGEAVVMCPLTRDRDLLMTFLDDASVQTISGGMTNLTSAITMATKMVQQANDGSTNLLTIFTDGEDFAGGLQSACEAAKQAGIHTFTIGVATDNGAPIPDLDLATGKRIGFVKDKNGSVVISKLHQDLLQQVAQKCDGYTLIAQVDNDQDLKEIVDWIVKFERQKLPDKLLTTKAEKYYYFAGFAFVLLLLEWVL